MNIPKRHHFVPQAHIRKFESAQGYFLLLKNEAEIKNPKSSADFFVKKELNTISNENGDKDHKTFEDELSIKWDNQFNNYYNSVLDNLINLKEIPCDTLKFFFEYSLIGLMRRKKMEKSFNDDFLEFKEVIPGLIDLMDSDKLDLSKFTEEEQKDGIDHFKKFLNEMISFDSRQSKMKYRALIPSEAKMLVPDNLTCDIFFCEENGFILPDCSATIISSNETMNWNSLNINKVSCVGIPLNPRLFLQIKNNDIHPGEINKIFIANEGLIQHVNENLLSSSFSQVVGADFHTLDSLKKECT